MAYVHTSVNQASEKYQRNEKRYNYTTPKSFLQQITLYKNLLEQSRSQLQHKMNRLESGLQKLQTTATQVKHLIIFSTEGRERLNVSVLTARSVQENQGSGLSFFLTVKSNTLPHTERRICIINSFPCNSGRRSQS